jgi:FkbM family methyltransferase
MQIGKLKLARCRYGWMLHGGPTIGKCFELYGEYSESEVAMMRAFVRPGDVVLDVGANIGDLTLPMSQMVGPQGRVYAFESHPETFNVLCGNLALNAVENVLPLRLFVAMSEAAETSSAQWGSTAYVGETWKPQFVAIDALDLDRCALIKVDVDGHELEVLRSGEMQIERYRPALYFENDLREASNALLSYVQGLGYDMFWHPAPVWSPDNFFGNPVNHWAPNLMISQMVVAVPREAKLDIKGLARIRSPDEWWEFDQSSG